MVVVVVVVVVAVAVAGGGGGGGGNVFTEFYQRIHRHEVTIGKNSLRRP